MQKQNIGSNKQRRSSARLAACAFVLFASITSSVDAATWTPLSNIAPSNIGTMMLLTDGTVMAQGFPYNTWHRLTPSSTGSYAAGTWSSLASMGSERLYFASHVLPNGKIWVLGGEYSGTPLGPTVTNTGEIYDPIANTWSPISPFPETSFGDDPTMLMNNGKILAGAIGSRMTYLYDIKTNTWSAAAPKAYDDVSDEENWVKLADGRVVTYDIFQSIRTSGQYAEAYDQKTNKWTSISPSDGSAQGTIPLMTSNALGAELGPLLKVRGPGVAGQIFMIGATGHTALYSPATNTWKTGPDIYGNLNGASVLFGAADAPAAVMPNGHVLLAADASPVLGTFQGPTQLFDFDPMANTIKPVSPAIPSTQLTTSGAYTKRMLVLPTGEILFSDASNQLWIYTPDGSADAASLPVYASVTYKGAGVFTMLGIRMNGPSAGSSYGDDVESDENYPIIRLRDNAGHVFYARTSNWSKTGVGTTVAEETVNFTLPVGMVPGNYSASVIGAGIAARERCISITANQISGIASGSPAALVCTVR